MMSWWRERLELLLFAAGGGLWAAGVAAWAADQGRVAQLVWVAGVVLGLVASAVWTFTAVRRRQPSVDVIAVLALAGALIVGEPFAGATVTLMLASGRLLESRASARAGRELSLLVGRVPRTARRRMDSEVAEVPVETLRPGDHVLVGTGEIVPVDGRLLGPAVLDESALTGEALPVDRPVGEEVRGGVVNAGPPLELAATTTAADSTYAGVVRLVEQAQASTAPFVRAADRVATLFVPLTLLVAGLAWMISGQAGRAVAVLVVATPCPLLLAAPIAIMSGLSRTTRLGVIVKGGGALERLARGQVMLFDKTGTLTRGQPKLVAVATAPHGPEAAELLRLAASLDQVSPHVLASAIVTAAATRGLALTPPVDVHEEHGHGLAGRVAGRPVALGRAAWIAPGAPEPWLRQVRRRADLDSSLAVYVAIDGRPAGALLFEDEVRPDAPRMIRTLRESGVERILLVTGDRADIAESVGRVVGVDAVLAECDPADKLAVVRTESQLAATIMVGDGVNDAPALAAAGVGVALAARGATASSEAADVVLTVDRIDALGDAILVARRSRNIAAQAVGVGMGLSLLAMAAAAVGWLPPAAGAVLQEGIDLLAIAIALRAVLPGHRRVAQLPPSDVVRAAELRTQHEAVLDVVEQVRAVADAMSDTAPDLAPARALLGRLDGELLPHELADEEQLVPIVARALGGYQATSSLTRSHAEIQHQVGRLRRMLADVDDVADSDDVIELRRLLYGLYAILRLHNAQEEADAFGLIPNPRSHGQLAQH